MAEIYYSDSLVTLYHGDCREVTDWLAADVLISDPPYGIGWRRGENKRRGSKRHTGIANDLDTTVRDEALALVAAMPAAVFGSLYAAPPPQVRHICIWEKPPDAGVVGSSVGFRRDVEAIYLVGSWPRKPPSRGSVLRSRLPNIGNPSSPAGRTGHPHAKPVDLMSELIQFAPPGVVVDPFAGSGSTLLAAKLLDRRAIGVELEERWCEFIARRFDQGVLDFGEVA